MIRKWEVTARETALNLGLFKVWRKQARHPRTGKTQPVLSIEFPHWVLVIPLTPDKEAVMVRQYRHGSGSICLEIPGGLLDAADGDPRMAAERELFEETGHTAGRMVKIGTCFPQPAVLSNQCFFYLAFDVKKTGAPALDPGEDIEIERVPLHTIPQRIATGDIQNGMVQLAFGLLNLQKPDLFNP